MKGFIQKQVLEIARFVTNQSDNDTARELFVKRLNESDMYFNTEDIPSSESDENAFNLCSNVEGAKKHCPVRWRTLQNQFKYIYQVGGKYTAINMSNWFYTTATGKYYCKSN